MIYSIDLHYFASVNYYKKIIMGHTLNLNLNGQYVKGGNLNKCKIAGANGILNLSIPIVGGRNQKASIGDLLICYEKDWQSQHLKSIKSCYGNAPFYQYYYPIIEELILIKFSKLYQLNLEITNKILKLLKKNISINIDNKYIVNYNDILFSKYNLKNNTQINNPNAYYPQVFEDRLGFIPNLSIIDLLMCIGPESNNYLQKT